MKATSICARSLYTAATPVAAISELSTLTRLKALANDLKFEIVRILADGERCVCNLEDLPDLPQSKVSYHLATLMDAAILTGERHGKKIYYRLERSALYNLGGELLNPAPELAAHLTSNC